MKPACTATLDVVLPAQLLVLVARDGRVANGPAEAGGGARLADDALTVIDAAVLPLLIK